MIRNGSAARTGSKNGARRLIVAGHQRLEAIKEPIEWPEPDSEVEDGMFAAATLIFVEPGKSERARHSLRQALGAKRFEYLLAFLAFVRTAHFWTLVHPELELEDDVKELVSRNPELGFLLLCTTPRTSEASGSKLTLSTELGKSRRRSAYARSGWIAHERCSQFPAGGWTLSEAGGGRTES